MNKINYVLNNENGSPSVEIIYIFGISLIIAYALMNFFKILNQWLPNFLSFIANA